MSVLRAPAGASSGDRVLWRGEAEGAGRVAAGRPGEVLRLLSRAWRNVALYGAGHAVAQSTINDLSQFLQDALARRPALRLFIQEDTFFEDGRVLLEETLRYYSLLTAFRQRLIGAIQLNAGVDRRELEHLLEILNLKPDELARRGGGEAYLRDGGVQHITVGSGAIAGTGALPAPTEKTREGAVTKVDPQDAYRAGLRVMDELSYRASLGLPLNLAQAKTVVNYYLDILSDERAAHLGIAALKNYDEDTYHHSVNVCILSMLVASRLHMDRTQLIVVGLAGLLHDIGKVRVPRAIIAKPGTLTAEEMDAVKRHPVHGAHILRELPGLSRFAMVAAFEHHAGFNLSGYPRITAKKTPHLITRIVFVADCFDAMTTARRVYRDPKCVEDALREILKDAGTVFDPVVAKLFCESCRAFVAAAREAQKSSPESASGHH